MNAQIHSWVNWCDRKGSSNGWDRDEPHNEINHIITKITSHKLTLEKTTQWYKEKPIQTCDKMLLLIVCPSVVLTELLEEVSKKSSSLKRLASPCPPPSQPNNSGVKQHTLPGHSLGMMGPFSHRHVHTHFHTVTRWLPLCCTWKTRLLLKKNFLLQVKW